MPLNCAVRDDAGEVMDIVAGLFIIVGLTENSFGSLNQDQLKNFEKEFH